MTDLLDGAMESLITEMHQQLERELLGAWRAGYDYVHVYSDTLTTRGSTPPHKTFRLRQYVLPTNSERPPTPHGRQYAYTYDLRNVSAFTVEQIQAAQCEVP